MYRFSCSFCTRFALRYRGIWRPASRCKHTAVDSSSSRLSSVEHNNSFNSFNWSPLQVRNNVWRDWVLSEQQPIQEITSFDDFGVLSQTLERTPSTETINSIGETSFLDQLLRSGSGSALSGYQSIPTTADISEMGGSSEGSIMDHLEEMMAEGYDVSNVIKDIAEENPKKRITYVDEASSPVFNTYDVPRRRIGTRRIITEEMIRERSRKVFMSSASAPSNSTHIKLSTSSSTSESEVEQAPTSASAIRFDPPMNRIGTVPINELRHAVKEESIAHLRDNLMKNKWPDMRSSDGLIIPLHELIVAKSVDADEAVMFFRDFASSSGRTYVKDVIVLKLCKRIAEEQGVQAAAAMLATMRNMFMTRAPRFHISQNQQAAIEDLLAVVCSKGSLPECQAVADVLLEKHYTDNRKMFMRAVVCHLLLKKLSFKDTFDSWCMMSNRYGTTHGVELIWELALDGTDKEIASRIALILSHCRVYDHPFSSIAECLCALVRLDRLEEAKQLAAKVSVSGKHFRDATIRTKNLADVEKLANLVTFCMYGEKKRVVTKKSSDKGQIVGEDTAIGEQVWSAIEHFCGFGGNRKKTTKKLSNGQQARKKLHKVDEEQLHQLAHDIQDVWIKLAEKNSNKEACEKLLTWSQVNKVDVPEGIRVRITVLLEKKL